MTRLVNSNIPWIDEIPKEWKINPLFSTASENKLKNKEKNKNVLSLSYGRIIKRDLSKNFGLIPENFNSYQVVNRGYIIIRSTDLQNDKNSLRVGLVKEYGVITSAYIGLSPNEQIYPEYLYHYLNMCDLKKVFYSLGGGLRQSLRFEEFRKFPILLPPVKEQKLIFCYLDKKTKQIDVLVEKINKKIKLLKEQRTSLIHKYVTKGLNPNVDMKDSGVEWIGQIPVNWSTPTLKHLIVESFGGEVIDKSFWGDGDEILYTTSKKIHKSDYPDFDNDRRTTKKDLLLSRNGDGVVHIPPEGCIYTNVVQLIRLQKNINRVFLWYSLTSQIKPLNSYSDGDFIVSLNKKQWFNLKIPLPHSEEQKKIVSSLDKQVKLIDKIESNEKKRLVLLKEYRQSLIFSVVTGKTKITKDMI